MPEAQRPQRAGARDFLDRHLPFHPAVLDDFDEANRIAAGEDGAQDVVLDLERDPGGVTCRLHGIATAGYSWMVNVLALTDANGNLIRYQTTSGLVIGFGMGGSYAINPRLLFVGEVSYQLGYQGTTVTEPPVMDLEVKAGSNYLTLGFGFLAAFGG